MGQSRFVCSREFRSSPAQLLKDVVSTGETCYITEDGKARAVLLDIHRYHALMDLIEESEALRAPDWGNGHEHLTVKAIARQAQSRAPRRAH